MNEGNPTNQSSDLHPHVSLAARVSIIAGSLSVVSVIFALSAAFLVMRAGIYTYLPTGRGYLYPLFWLLWLPLPIVTILCGSYARKTATEQGRDGLAFIGLVLGYLSLAIIGTIVLAEISLFFHSLRCTPDSPCS